MRPSRVVVDAPRFDDPPGFGERGEDVFIQAFVAQAAIEALDEGGLIDRDATALVAGSTS
jgi:hypothetical protein